MFKIECIITVQCSFAGHVGECKGRAWRTTGWFLAAFLTHLLYLRTRAAAKELGQLSHPFSQHSPAPAMRQAWLLRGNNFSRLIDYRAPES